MFSVYKRTNKTTGKVYIGFTGKTIERRWQNCVAKSKNTKRNNKLLSAIQEFGEFDWIHETLEKVACRSIAGVREIYYIGFYKSDVDGYNTYCGGTSGFSIPEQTRNKISDANTGKKRSPEVRHAIKIRTSGKNNPMYGKAQTQKTKCAVSNRRRSEADQTLRDWIHCDGRLEKNITCLGMCDKYEELLISKMNAVAKELKNSKGYLIGVSHKGWRIHDAKN